MKPLAPVTNAVVIVCGIYMCRARRRRLSDMSGRWQLTEISADGNPLTEYSGNMSWAFQRDIVGITTVTDYHSALETWGQWKSDDNTYLSLNFDYTCRSQTPPVPSATDRAPA